jgi:predicted N-acetyltransferase YhbS
MEIKIAKAKPSDDLEILKLERRIWKEDFHLKDVAGKYDLGSFIRLGLVFVAKYKNKIVGTIISFVTKTGEIFIADWIVDEKYRNLGIGTRLYNKLKSNAKKRKFITYIETRYKDSIRIHKKMGFKIKKKVRDIYGIGEKKSYYVFVKTNI